MLLSKSDYMTYLKHPAWLWLKKHYKDMLPPTSPNLQAQFDEGTNYEPYAEQLFPDGVKLGWDPKKYGSYDELLAKTQVELDKGTKTIFQGRFLAGNLTFICDIIDRAKDGGFDLYEIKATTSVKKEHKPDLSFQQVVLELLGYKVNNIYVIHLNNEYTRKGAIDIQELSTVEDVTDDVKALKPVTEEKIPLALDVAKSDTMPNASPRHIGISTYKKEWMEILRLLKPDLPEYSIYDLAGRNGDVVQKMEDRGIYDLSQLPEKMKISGKKAKTQLLTTKKKKKIINKENIQRFLGDLKYPLYFLDYESFKKTVPLYDGIRPYQQIVFQYSVHTLDSPEAELRHDMYLHTEDSNPIEPLTASLMKIIGAEGSVLVWHMVFERDRNIEMGEHSKEFLEFYQDLNERIVDLERPFQKDWYARREFKGSSSIKAVLPVLIPDLSYNDLEIQDGLTTGRIWTEIVLDNRHGSESEKLFEEMRKYNTLDTLAMVEIYRKLNELVS